MKILAMEVEREEVSHEQFEPHLKAESWRAWELYQNSVIRELYFRADRAEAVLILECADTTEAEQVLGTLPLVPYTGFGRLFEE